MASSVKVAAAKIVEQRSHIVPGKLRVTEHFFSVPKDYTRPETGNIKLFARSVRKHETPAGPSTTQPDPPWMVFLNGGPGHACRAPQQYPLTSILLDKGYQVLYLDQRGTGLSTPVTASTLGLRGGTDVQASYLKLYRADSIVRDCEAIRQALLGAQPAEKQKWSILGQSFGGFVSISYLSLYPESLVESFILGGLQPLVSQPDEVYRRLYRKVVERNEAYYAKYSEDVARVRLVVGYLRRFGNGTIKLPGQGLLTVRRFQQMGIHLGFHGGIDSIHDVILRAAYDIEAFGHLTRGTLSSIEAMTNFDDALIYAILHEPIYCQGNKADWAAERVRKEFSEFDAEGHDADSKDKPVYFTGEMVFPWMFEDHFELKKVQEVAERVAAFDDWGMLFDEEQLARNQVPVYAAAYTEDMYVDFDLSKQTAKKIKGCKLFVTNVMYHDAVRSKVNEVVEQLFALRSDVID